MAQNVAQHIFVVSNTELFRGEKVAQKYVILSLKLPKESNHPN
jgi:hypothetical protein